MYDVDFKDNGYQEHLKYTQEFGDLDTYTVESGGDGGYHFYFEYDSSNYLMVKYLMFGPSSATVAWTSGARGAT